MSAKIKNKPSKWSKILTYVLVVLLIFGVIEAAVYFLLPSENKNGKYTDFTVAFNGNAVALESEMTIYAGQNYEFTVAYSNEGEAIENPYDFSVDIIPNATLATEFQYTVDGEEKWFTDLVSMKDAFSIEMTDNGFTLQAPEAFTMQDILSQVYTGKTVDVPDNIEYGKYFTLVVSSYDNAVQYKVIFEITENGSDITPPDDVDPGETIPVESIILDKEAILF